MTGSSIDHILNIIMGGAGVPRTRTVRNTPSIECASYGTPQLYGTQMYRHPCPLGLARYNRRQSSSLPCARKRLSSYAAARPQLMLQHGVGPPALAPPATCRAMSRSPMGATSAAGTSPLLRRTSGANAVAETACWDRSPLRRKARTGGQARGAIGQLLAHGLARTG